MLLLLTLHGVVAVLEGCEGEGSGPMSVKAALPVVWVKGTHGEAQGSRDGEMGGRVGVVCSADTGGEGEGNEVSHRAGAMWWKGLSPQNGSHLTLLWVVSGLPVLPLRWRDRLTALPGVASWLPRLRLCGAASPNSES